MYSIIHTTTAQTPDRNNSSMTAIFFEKDAKSRLT